MTAYITIVLYMALLPVISAVLFEMGKQSFDIKENKDKSFLNHKLAQAALILSELALVRIWFSLGRPSFVNTEFLLLYVILAAMTTLCVADRLEKVVPNKILLLLLMIFVIIIGMQAVRDAESVVYLLTEIIMGFMFCLLVFGLTALVSKGGIGAGDVKLSMIMGLYLTGKYVVSVIFLGCLASAGYALIQIMRKKMTAKTRIPFVPFLYMGLIIRYFIG